jgi:hypothetical protein
MKISKASLVNGTYALMRISGLTVNPTPEDVTIGLQVADDYSQELLADGLDIGWQYPTEYGVSDPDDNSGLTPQMAGPFKKLLYVQLCSYFGKEVPQTVAVTSMAALRTLEQLLVNVPDAQNPPTLPFGSGNENDYRDRSFYNEPPVNNNANYVFKGDIDEYSHDFSNWLVDETLVSVVWANPDSGITISSDTFDDTIAMADLTFVNTGGSFVTITATKTSSAEQLTIRKNFVISDPVNSGLIYGAYGANL